MPSFFYFVSAKQEFFIDVTVDTVNFFEFHSVSVFKINLCNTVIHHFILCRTGKYLIGERHYDIKDIEKAQFNIRASLSSVLT